MEKRDLGEEIKNLVQDALIKGDFKDLNKDIEGIVKGALAEAKKSLDWTKKTSQDSKSSQVKKNRESRRKDYAVAQGQVSGPLLTILGSIGSGIFGTGIVMLTILGFRLDAKGIFHSIAIISLPLFLLSFFALSRGRSIQKRLKRFHLYLGRMFHKDYSTIKELSQASGLSAKATVKDLRKMVGLGMFPQGHIDDKENYFMLSHESYEAYLMLQEGIRAKEEEEKAEENIPPSELRKALDEGRNQVAEIRRANDILLGEEISLKLDRLEEVTGKIFDYVENHPEKLPEIRKFTEYFLPTTLKLIEGYKKLDHQPIEGQNILSAKKEIEETMDTIILAFENLLDDLFVDMAMDISTDISVLETMFAQEGLTKDGFNKK